MLRSFTAAVVLSLIVALAAPASGMAQGAGDQQYADPLAGDDGGGGGGGNSGSGGNPGAGSDSGGSSGSGSSAPSTSGQSQDTAPTPQADTTAAPQSSSELPRTGYPAWLAALAGGVLLASGATLRLSAGRRT